MKNIKFIMILLVMSLAACQNNDWEEPREQEKQTYEPRERLWMNKTVPPATKGVAPTDKLWKAGDIIRIKFLNGTPAIQEKVKKYAAKWLNYANLTFEYVDQSRTAEVKIGFDMEDNYIAWSATGTDCKQIAQDAPSLNFIWLEDESDEAVIEGEVLRGFGHILGLVFEHQNPSSSVRIKPTADIAGEYNISEAEAEEIRRQYTTGQTNYSQYDKSSIMVLDIPRTMLVNPRDYVSANKELSANDTAFIGSLYPFPEVSVRMKTTGTSVSILILGDTDIPNVMYVNWGDGERQNNTLNNNYHELTHTYKDGAAEHIITISGDVAILECSNNQLTELDVTNADTTLYQLACGNNQIKTLDLTRTTSLEVFACLGNSLTALDLTKNTILVSLVCGGNPFTALDLEKNTRLRILYCKESNVKKLDVSRNTELFEIECENGNIEEIVTGNNPDLDRIYCQNNKISSLTLGGAPNLRMLYCDNNNIATLDTKGNTLLNVLRCRENNNIKLDVSANQALGTLDCASNNLGTLDVSKNTKLGYLDCSGNSLETLDVTSNPILERLLCIANKLLTKLDLSQNPQLNWLQCSSTGLINLDLSKNTKLNYLNCNYSKLTGLDVTGLNELSEIHCEGNPFVADILKITSLATSLPQRPVGKRGELWINDTTAQKNIQKICDDKNWAIDMNVFNTMGMRAVPIKLDSDEISQTTMHFDLLSRRNWVLLQRH